MKIGLVGYPGSGKSTVFGALTGLDVETGFGAGKANLGAVKVPDARVDALSALYEPKKTTYAEITFSDLGAGSAKGSTAPRSSRCATSMRCARCCARFPTLRASRAIRSRSSPASRPRRCSPTSSSSSSAWRSSPRIAATRASSRCSSACRRRSRASAGALARPREEEAKSLSGYALLTAKPLLLVLNVAEGDVAAPAPEELARAAAERGLGLVVLSAQVEMDIAQLDAAEQGEFLASLGLSEPAVHRFVRAAFELIDLISMLTVGPDECRAWPVPRGTLAPRAAGKIHSDIERGFIRAEVIRCEDLLKYGSEAKCKDAGALRDRGQGLRGPGRRRGALQVQRVAATLPWSPMLSAGRQATWSKASRVLLVAAGVLLAVWWAVTGRAQMAAGFTASLIAVCAGVVLLLRGPVVESSVERHRRDRGGRGARIRGSAGDPRAAGEDRGAIRIRRRPRRRRRSGIEAPFGRISQRAREAEARLAKLNELASEASRSDARACPQRGRIAGRAVAPTSGARDLSADQSEVLASSLRASGTHEITLTTDMNDSEAIQFARSLKQAIEAGGWTVHGVNQNVSSRPVVGLRCAHRFPSRPRATLLSALGRAGLHPQGMSRQRVEKLEVLVGSRPGEL